MEAGSVEVKNCGQAKIDLLEGFVISTSINCEPLCSVEHRTDFRLSGQLLFTSSHHRLLLRWLASLL